MNILLVAATAQEIQPFLHHYTNSKTKPGIDFLITGVGLTNTCYHILKQIQLKKPGLVIQAGIAGGFDKKIPLTTVVAVKAEVTADLAVSEKKEFKSVFDLKLADANQFPFTNGWLVNNSKIMDSIKLKKIKAISVNEITTSGERIGIYRKKFNPVAESLEGAAMHYVCLMEKIPFLQLRVLSNYIGERDKKKWRMKESILNLNHELIKLVESL